MSPTLSWLLFWSDTPSLINWSDARALKEQEATIIEMSTIWQLQEEDIHGWHHKVRRQAWNERVLYLCKPLSLGMQGYDGTLEV
jgi:hypothetical protein